MQFINQLLDDGSKILKSAGIESARFDAKELLIYALNCDTYSELLRKSEVSLDSQKQYWRLIEKRAERYPLQYLLGFWEFYGRRFSVSEGVLIPRQDTECLIEVALELLKGKETPVILDLCSGTGIISVTLALERPGALVEALELYPQAIECFQKNAGALNAKVTLHQADVFSFQPTCCYDLIISNPPYIPEGELPCLQPEVQFEPIEALNGGSDGFLFYNAILQRYIHFLSVDGAVLLEAGDGQAGRIADSMRENNLRKIKIGRDYSGNLRWVCGRRI